MENNEVSNVAPESSETESSQSVADQTPVDNASPEATPSEGTTPQDANPVAEEGDQELEVVKDDQGNEFIPKAAFEARIAKLTAQKHNAAAQLIEAIKTNPEVKQQFEEALGHPISTESQDAAEPESDGPTPFEGWLDSAQIPAEVRPHYKNMAESLFGTFMPHFQREIQNAIKPLLSVVGQQHVEKFASSNPDFNQYKGEIQKIMASGRAKTLEDAYKIASWDKKIKGAGTSAIQQEKARQAKLAATPVRKAQGNPASQRKPANLAEAFRLKAEQIGYKG